MEAKKSSHHQIPLGISLIMNKQIANIIQGHGVSLITPFNKIGDVDYPALERLTKTLSVSNVNFIVVLGNASEAALLDNDEQVRVMDFVSEINNGAKPLMGGVASNSTRNAIRRLSVFNRRDFTAVFCGSPLPKASSNTGQIGHYRSLAQESPLPIFLHHQNAEPGLSEWVMDLGGEKNIAGAVDESGALGLIDHWLRERPDGFSILSARDIMTLPLYSLGIDGAVSTIGNAFPNEFGEMIDLLAFGALNDGRKRHHELAPLMHLLELEGKPTAIKSILAQLHRCHSAVRLPNTPVSEATQRAIYQALAELPEHISINLLEENA